jgi:valyl-tRNA synthetase
MSKSLNNGVDPLEVIDQYGADALRFMLITGNSPGNDMRYQNDKVEASRNFANKLWNASRFVLMGIDGDSGDLDGSETLELSDKWILSRMNTVAKEITANMDKYELGMAATKVYDFVWNEYCDWYIELAKKRLYGENETEKQTVQKVLVAVLKQILKMLHPFMPFITEEIWAHIPGTEGRVIVMNWPEYAAECFDGEAEAQMDRIMNAIRGIRNVRAEMDVAPSRKAKLIVVAEDKVTSLLLENEAYMQSLASASEVVAMEDKKDVPEDAVSVVIDGGEVFLPLEELIDFEKELDRLNKEKAKLEKEVDRVNKKLNNQGFLAKAPEHLVQEERDKKDKYEDMLKTVVERIQSMQSKMK